MAARWIYYSHECSVGCRWTNRKHVTASLIQDKAPGGPVHLEVSLRVTTKCQRRFELLISPNVIGGNPTVRKVVKGAGSAGDEASEEQFATHPDTLQRIRQTAGTKRGAEDVMDSPAKRVHTIPIPLTQALLFSATGRGAMLVPGDAMRISMQCEEYVCRPDVKVVFDADGEFRDHYNGEVLQWSLKVTGTNNETTRTEKFGVPTRGHKSKKPSTQRVTRTNVFNRSKRNQVRSRVLTRENTAGVSAPEHYVSARACRMMSKGRTRQLVSYHVLAVSFRAWLERDARVKPPKDFRLSDDWLRYVMKAFLFLSPDASRRSAIFRRNLRWPTEGVRRATDVEHVGCSADTLEVEGARLSSKSSPRTTARDALELLTTAETAAGTGLHLRPDRSDQQSSRRELAQDVQELSMSSVWGSGDWNGDAVTCRSISAGAVRLKSHTIEMRYLDRREARVQSWKENRTNDVNSDARGDAADDTAENAKGTGVQEYQVGAEEVDVADLSNKETEGLKRRGEQFLEVRKALEMPMQDTETARERELVRRSVLEAELVPTGPKGS